MKVGDLVKFHTDAWIFETDYSNPGLIIEKDDSHRQLRYTVMWSDGKITKETTCYLRLSEKK